MENRGRKRAVIVTVIILIIIFAGTAAYLALWKNKKQNVAVGDPGPIVDRLRILQVTGGKLEVSEGELNGTLKALFDKPVEMAGVVVNDVYADINNGSITFYAPVKYKNMNLLPNITGKIRYENERVIFDISSVKVGKLSVPKSLLLEQLRNYSNKDIDITGNSIEISKYLLPFNAKNIYLEDDNIIAEVDKLNILKEKETSENAADKGNTTETSQNTGTGKNNSTAQNTGTQKTSQNGTAAQNNASGTGQKDNMTPVPASAKAAQAETLTKVSSQLNGVIASVATPKEKQMMKKIQSVVSEVSRDPSYPYQGEANEVKAWYSTLKPEEKARVKKAILNNVNPMEILKLVNIFGV